MSRDTLELFKKHNITKCVCTFSCGGDSMNNTEFEYSTESGEEVPEDVKGDLTNFFEIDMYDKVEFYVNSDGHYEGEAGTVTITPTDIDDDSLEDSNGFSYEKDSEEEWNESFTDPARFPLTAAEKAFINKNILNINGGEGGFAFNFKRDCILTDTDETLMTHLQKRIEDFIKNRTPGCEYEGELRDDGPRYTTNGADEEEEEVSALAIDGNELLFSVFYQAIVFKKGGEIINNED